MEQPRAFGGQVRNRRRLPGIGVEADQQLWCPKFDADVRVSSLQTGVFAGPVGSTVGQHRFNPDAVVREAQENVRFYTPQYGLFQVRAKATDDPLSMVALWMIGYEDEPERSAEIWICEIFGPDVGPDQAASAPQPVAPGKGPPRQPVPEGPGSSVRPPPPGNTASDQSSDTRSIRPRTPVAPCEPCFKPTVSSVRRLASPPDLTLRSATFYGPCGGALGESGIEGYALPARVQTLGFRVASRAPRRRWASTGG